MVAVMATLDRRVSSLYHYVFDHLGLACAEHFMKAVPYA
jgi:hypothetical protein